MEKAKKAKNKTQSGIVGSKPAPLKVSKDSQNCRKIKPLIIYLRSPKVIHSEAKDFKAVVQRLTGCRSSSSSSSFSLKEFSAPQTHPNSNAFSPLEKKDAALEITHPPPVLANDCFSPPWNPFPEDIDLSMLWDL